jgi:two-component system, OmpR family, sensor histidine kinase TctE
MPDSSYATAPGFTIPVQKAAEHQAADVIRHLAHELRQPLSTIESIAYYLEIILPKTEGKALDQLEKLQEMVHQCNWILADVIHFLQATPVRLELLDLAGMVSENLAEWSSGGNHEILIEGPAHLPLVMLDAAQIQHLLCNLFTFYQQISRGMPVSIRTSATDRGVHLRISCQSPAYEADVLKSLCEPFSPHLPGGSGLALASVRRIAEAHGAEISAQWGPAEGLAVTLTFPLPA